MSKEDNAFIDTEELLVKSQRNIKDESRGSERDFYKRIREKAEEGAELDPFLANVKAPPTA